MLFIIIVAFMVGRGSGKARARFWKMRKGTVTVLIFRICELGI